MPVSEEIVIKTGGARSSNSTLPRRVGDVPSPEAQQIARLLDAEQNLVTRQNNPNRPARHVDDTVQARCGGSCNIRNEVVPLDREDYALTHRHIRQ